LIYNFVHFVPFSTTEALAKVVLVSFVVKEDFFDRSQVDKKQ